MFIKFFSLATVCSNPLLYIDHGPWLWKLLAANCKIISFLCFLYFRPSIQCYSAASNPVLINTVTCDTQESVVGFWIKFELIKKVENNLRKWSDMFINIKQSSPDHTCFLFSAFCSRLNRHPWYMIEDNNTD